MIQFNDTSSHNAVVKVIGVGGGGCNAVNTMITARLDTVDFIVANTDLQALRQNTAEHKLQLGKDLTKGLGAGADPLIGKASANESRERICRSLEEADMLFIAAGMGGGTGTGAAPVIAEIARDMGILTVGVVTKPFLFEGKKRLKIAESGIDELSRHVDSLIVIPNQKLFSLAGKATSLLEGFKKADEVLLHAIKSISDLINVPGLINLDFADVKTIMTGMGMAYMGIGEDSGEHRAAKAAQKALENPLLDDISINGARGLLINLAGDSSLSFADLEEATSFVQERVHEEANIVFGAIIDEDLKENCRLTVIATGFSERIAVDREIAAPSAEPKQESAPDRIFTKNDSKVVKVGTIISEFADDDEYDIPTFIRSNCL